MSSPYALLPNLSPPTALRSTVYYYNLYYTVRSYSTPLNYALNCASDKKSQRHVQREVILSLIYPLLFLAASLHGMRRLPLSYCPRQSTASIHSNSIHPGYRVLFVISYVSKRSRQSIFLKAKPGSVANHVDAHPGSYWYTSVAIVGETRFTM